MQPTYLTALGFLDLVGIGMFALSGALLAAQKRQDFVTFVFFAVVTGVGGGTVRDLLIGAPVFWMHENWILLICLAAALLAWFTPLRLWGRSGLVWADALGIAAYQLTAQPRRWPTASRRFPRSAWESLPRAWAASFATCWRGSLRSCCARSSMSPRRRSPLG
jgi:hypothetical protein